MFVIDYLQGAIWFRTSAPTFYTEKIIVTQKTSHESHLRRTHDF